MKTLKRNITYIKSMKYAIIFILLCSLGCKKEPTKPADQPDGNAFNFKTTAQNGEYSLFINGQSKDISTQYILKTGDSLRLWATGVDTYNPATGQINQGKLEMYVYKDGIMIYDKNCYCDADFKYINN